MKTLTTLICFLLTIFSVYAEDKVDPFNPEPPKVIDRSKDEGSKLFLRDDLLKAFGEKRLDNGTDKAVLRITVMRSFHAPLMFKWFPSEDGKDAWLHVKTLKVDSNADGDRVYKGLDTNKRIKLTTAQRKLLQTTYGQSPMQDLPQPFWQPEALDGSRWIYEVAAEGGGSILIARRNPIDPRKACIDFSKIRPERLAKELQLTSFTLLLWALSGVDERPY
jgi:hypothetical protein